MRYLLALFSLTMLGASLFVGYAAFVFAGLSCDERCYGDPGDWSTNPDAWQWDAAQLVSVSLAVTAFLFVGAMVARAETLAVALLLVQAGATAVLVTFAATGTTMVSSSLPLVSAIAFAPVLVGAATVTMLRGETRRAVATSGDA